MRVLAGSPLTRELSTDDRRDVNGHLTAWSWAEGDPLMLVGDELSGSYLVVSGRVRVTHDTADGREITVDIAGPGDIVGRLSTEPAVATESAWAMETTCALFLPADSLAKVVGDHPRLALALMRLQQEGLAQARDREIARATQPVSKRIASAVRYLDRKFGSSQRDGSSLLQVRLRRDDIAGLAGTTMESASRAMATLKKSGVIDSGREWVSVLDPIALDRLTAGE